VGATVDSDSVASVPFVFNSAFTLLLLAEAFSPFVVLFDTPPVLPIGVDEDILESTTADALVTVDEVVTEAAAAVVVAIALLLARIAPMGMTRCF
jgi:hypothetical protein